MARNTCRTAGELKTLLNRSADPKFRMEVQAARPIARAYEAEVRRLEVGTGLVEADEAHGAAIEAVREFAIYRRQASKVGSRPCDKGPCHKGVGRAAVVDRFSPYCDSRTARG